MSVSKPTLARYLEDYPTSRFESLRSMIQGGRSSPRRHAATLWEMWSPSPPGAEV